MRYLNGSSQPLMNIVPEENVRKGLRARLSVNKKLSQFMRSNLIQGALEIY